MRIVITGGAGFIGSTIADQCKNVVIIDNLSSGNIENIPKHATFIKGDICDKELLQKTIQKDDIILHLAAVASVPASIKDPELTRKVNVEGTKNILEIAAQNGAKRVVFSSSAAVYGNSEDTNSESSPTDPLSPYAQTKLQGEALCKEFADKIDTVCLRYFNVYGKKQNPESDYAAVIPLFVKLMKQNKSPTIFGDGTQTRDFIHVSDIVRANLMSATDAKKLNGESFNIATGSQISILDLVQTINTIMKTDIKPTFDPPREGDIKASSADVKKAREMIGFSAQTSFEDGLKDLILPN